MNDEPIDTDVLKDKYREEVDGHGAYPCNCATCISERGGRDTTERKKLK